VNDTAELFLRNAGSDDVAAWFEDRSYSYRELAVESLRRAALWEELRRPSMEPHIGVLLDNTPEYLFWLGAAAITRSVIVGINATYRGAELARLIDHCDCQLLVASETYADILAGAPSSVAADRVLRTDTPHYAEALAGAVDRVFHLEFRSPARFHPLLEEIIQAVAVDLLRQLMEFIGADGFPGVPSRHGL